MNHTGMLHCSFREWQIKHRDANSDEYLVVDGDEQKIMSIVGFDFFQEC
jgi:hypothetical protein